MAMLEAIILDKFFALQICYCRNGAPRSQFTILGGLDTSTELQTKHFSYLFIQPSDKT